MIELADILDDLSFRSSKAAQLAALERLHTTLADVCVRPNEPNQRTRFLALQNDFETNIVSRVLSSNIISASAAPRAVDELRTKSSSTTVDITSLALSVLQGMALIHPRSKAYMGRKLGIQTLLDLLTALRHASTNPDDPDATIVSGIDTSDAGLATSLSPLACSVIDTLLCLLVDSPPALRVFEECNGLEVIVRTLKKVTGQSVRMKCLEFLYFYLQDEDVLAVAGVPVVDAPPTPANAKSPPAARTKSSRTTIKPSTSASPSALQTPRRPKAQQTPATDVRPRTRAPLERTVSGDSTHSMMSSCSDTSARPGFTRDRSVSRASSIASTASNVTASSTKSGVKMSTTDPELRFHRTSVVPSLSYSSSTISSTSTNQTLDQPQQSDAFLQAATPSQTRPTTPNSLTQECLVPLPESPVKPGGLDTPKPKRRLKTEETPSSRVREREKGQDTPRAKIRSRDQPAPSANLFPSSGTTTPPSSSPFGNPSSKPNDLFRPKPVLNLSLLTGEIDYEPVSPQKRNPSRVIGDDNQQPDTPSKEPSSNPFRSPSSNPFQSPAPDPAAKPAKHRPRQSEILPPRPALIRPGPRIVSTPPSTTPTTPIGTAPSTPTHGSGAATPPVATPPAPTPAAETPGRKKRAVLPGGARIPGVGRSEGSGDLRKSVIGATVGGVKPQPSSEGLRKSQASTEGEASRKSGELRRSQYASSEALKKAQASPEGPRKDVLRKSLASSPDLRREKDKDGLRAKKSAPSTPVVGKLARIRAEEGRSSGEGSRPSMESEKRISFEEPTSASSPGRPVDKKIVRSSAEKKELLGAWLGNVDALVEGVQRAGVWGLR